MKKFSKHYLNHLTQTCVEFARQPYTTPVNIWLKMDFQLWYTLVLLFITSILLIKESFETELILLSFLFLLILGKVISVKEAFVGFSNEGMITIGFLFIVAAGLNNSGLMAQLQNLLFGKSNHSGYRKKLIRILFPITGVSAFINNTPVVALLIPALKSWTERLNLAPCSCCRASSLRIRRVRLSLL